MSSQKRRRRLARMLFTMIFTTAVLLTDVVGTMPDNRISTGLRQLFANALPKSFTEDLNQVLADTDLPTLPEPNPAEAPVFTLPDFLAYLLALEPKAAAALAAPSATETVAAASTNTPLPTPTPTFTLTPSATATMTATLTATFTATPLPTSGPGTVRQNTLCHAGPGIIYNWVTRLTAGQTITVTGITTDGQWLQIVHPMKQSAFCWVSNAAVTLSVETAGLPNPPIPPTPTITPTFTPTSTPILEPSPTPTMIWGDGGDGWWPWP